MKLLAAFFLLACLWFGSGVPASAQRIGGSASISVTGTSSNVAFPANTQIYPFVFLAPAIGSTQEIFYITGNSMVTATTSSPALPANGICINVGPDTNVAAITSTSTATLRITQVTTCPPVF